MVMVTACSLTLATSSDDSGNGNDDGDPKPKFDTFLPTWALDTTPAQQGVNKVVIKSINNGNAGVTVIGSGDRAEQYDMFSANGIHLKFIGFGGAVPTGKTIEQYETERVASNDLFGRFGINITPENWEVTAMTDFYVTYQTKQAIFIPITNLGGYSPDTQATYGAVVKYKGSITFYNRNNSTSILNDKGYYGFDPNFKIVFNLMAYNPHSGAVVNNPLQEYLTSQLNTGGNGAAPPTVFGDDEGNSPPGHLNNTPIVVYIEF